MAGGPQHDTEHFQSRNSKISNSSCIGEELTGFSPRALDYSEPWHLRVKAVGGPPSCPRGGCKVLVSKPTSSFQAPSPGSLDSPGGGGSPSTHLGGLRSDQGDPVTLNLDPLPFSVPLAQMGTRQPT